MSDADRELRRLTRRGFLTGGIAAVAGALGWRWALSRPEQLGAPWPLRKVLEANGKLWGALGCGREAPRLAAVSGRDARENGDIGLERPADLDGWRVEVEGGAKPLSLSMEELRRLPKAEATIEFKCIEGWSQVMSFAGARFSDLMDRYGLPKTRYVGLETPDKAYYVSLDMDSMRHPQTLLAWEMNGSPLSQAHGAPLRLMTPVKYGIKSLKRAAKIRFADERPPDYWGERGYDWHAGL